MGTDLLTKLHDARVQAKRDSDTIARLVGERNAAREECFKLKQEIRDGDIAVALRDASIAVLTKENARLWAALSTQAELQIQ